jgi:hypothetical protein
MQRKNNMLHLLYINAGKYLFFGLFTVFFQAVFFYCFLGRF